MATTDRDLQALTYLANRLREDTHGCREWDDAGTFAVLKSELGGTDLRTAIERVVGHACDPEARTPGAIRRPFTPEPPPSSRHPHPLRRDDECPAHSGQRRGNCGGCATDAHAYDDPPKPTPAWQGATDHARRKAEALAQLRGGTHDDH